MKLPGATKNTRIVKGTNAAFHSKETSMESEGLLFHAKC